MQRSGWAILRPHCEVLFFGAALLTLPLRASADSAVTEAVLRYLAAHKAPAGSTVGASESQTSAFESSFNFRFLIDHSLVVPLPPPDGAALQVTSSRWDRLQRQLEFHLECSTVGTCRPFLATLRASDSEIPLGLRGITPDAPTGKEHRNSQPVGKLAARARPLVHAGEHVRLVMTGPGIRMKIPVVCLESGALGQTIRARSMEDPKIFYAQVVGAGLLTSVF